MTSIFLCHSSLDKSFVRELAVDLEKAGVAVWVDEAEIKVGESLLDKIGRAIEETKYVGVVLSSNSVNSRWVQRELKMAMHKELQENRIVVLPLLLSKIDIPIFLADRLYADFTDLTGYQD